MTPSGSALPASLATSSTTRAETAAGSGTPCSRAASTWASSRTAWKPCACSGSRRATFSSARTLTLTRLPRSSAWGGRSRMDKADFVGRQALAQIAALPPRLRLVGLRFEGDGGAARGGAPYRGRPARRPPHLVAVLPRARMRDRAGLAPVCGRRASRARRSRRPRGPRRRDTVLRPGGSEAPCLR